MKKLYMISMIPLMLNLQLFADGDTGATAPAATSNINVTTDQGLSAENKTYYDMALIDEASAELVHRQFAQKRPIPKNGGKTINFRKFAALAKATTPLTEGVTPSGKKLSVSEIESTLAQYGDFIEMSDVLELTAIDNVVLEAVKVSGRQAGLTLDTVTRNVMQSGTNVFYCPKSDGAAVTSRAALDATCKLTVDVVKRVVAFLKKNNAPKIDGSYIAIVHPYGAYDLMSDPAWIDPHKYHDTEELYEGELGKIAGVRFIESSEAKVYEGGVLGTLIFGANAYGTTELEGGGLETIIKQLGSGGASDPLNQRSSVGWKANQTDEILVEAYLCRVESKSEMSADLEEN